MRLSQIIKVRRVAAAGALAAMLWCGQARADVLDQVPSDAVGVVKIKSLEQLNTKVAKMAKTFGLDELQPDMKDPLKALLDKAHLKNGLNKSGDAALAMFAPEKGENDEPVAVALVPVSDYDAFVGNFKKAAQGSAGEITAVQDPEETGKTLYLTHRGAYAVMSDKKSHLTGHGGIKLTAAAAHEADNKDIVFFFNMPVVRDTAINAITKDRKKWIEEMDKTLTVEEPIKKFVPVFDTVINKALDTAVEFLHDANAIVFSANISDAGISYGGLVDFAADSKMGKTVAECKPGNVPLLSGLPDRKYFFVGGMSMDPKVTAQIASEWIDPIVKDLNNTGTPMGKQIADLLVTCKSAAGVANHTAAGWLVPTKPLGQESLFQQVAVTYGDAKTMASTEKKLLGSMNDLMLLIPNQGVKTKIEFGETKTIDGVEIQSYTTKMDFDPNDPKGMQAQQLLGMLYGPKGNSGSFGAVNDHVFVVASGADDELLKELIGSAKAQKDVLSQNAGIKAVAAQLPANPTLVYYVSLDNIVSTAVRYAQGFGLPIKMKLPQDLPPIGIAAGAEGSVIRFDAFVPTETVQSLIAAGIQAYTQMQGGAGGGL